MHGVTPHARVRLGRLEREKQQRNDRASHRVAASTVVERLRLPPRNARRETGDLGEEETGRDGHHAYPFARGRAGSAENLPSDENDTLRDQNQREEQRGCRQDLTLDCRSDVPSRCVRRRHHGQRIVA